ncbi:MAG TPA: pilus assembly protein PilM [Candidatus Methylomirabilis sp.]|nr:pilus assembly protein PilM [Candidatus Methylomirabilis sp.]HSC70429.1 pilus assembly protein PilM [Candidatus Methylomirabilis sp.]
MVKRSLGISIKEEHASYVELGKLGGRIRLLSSGTFPLPPGNDRPLPEAASGAADPASLQAGATGGLPESLVRRRPDEVVIGLPRRAIVFRSLDLPGLDEKDLAGLLAYEIDRHLPFPPEEACYHFQRLKHNGGKGTVMLVATRRADLERHLLEVGRLGLQPTAVDVSAFAATNALVYRQRPKKGEALCLIELGARQAEVSVVRDGSLLFSRALSFADVPFEPLLQELQRAIEDGMPAPTRILVSGGSDALCLRLGEALGIPIEQWSPAIPPVDASAFGLALKGLVKLPIRIDLLPPERRPKRRERAVVVMFALLALLGALGVAWGAGSAYRERRTLNRLMLRVAEAKAQAPEVAALKAEFVRLRNQLQVLDGIALQRGRGLMALKELVSLLPGNVYLTEFILEGNKVQIRGTTGGSASELIAAFERSSHFENAAFTSPISAQGTDRQGFQLQAFVKDSNQRAGGSGQRPAGSGQGPAGSGQRAGGSEQRPAGSLEPAAPRKQP